MSERVKRLIEVLNANPQGCNQYGCRGGGRSARLASAARRVASATYGGFAGGDKILGKRGAKRRTAKQKALRREVAQSVREQRAKTGARGIRGLFKARPKMIDWSSVEIKD